MLESNTQDPAPVVEITLKEDQLIGFHIDNEPTKADYIFINNLLSAHLVDKEKLLILLRLQEMIDIEINYLFGELKTIFEFYKKKTKVAIVATQAVQQQININKLVLEDIEIRCFDLEEEKVAIDWLS